MGPEEEGYLEKDGMGLGTAGLKSRVKRDKSGPYKIEWQFEKIGLGTETI